MRIIGIILIIIIGRNAYNFIIGNRIEFICHAITSLPDSHAIVPVVNLSCKLHIGTTDCYVSYWCSYML